MASPLGDAAKLTDIPPNLHDGVGYDDVVPFTPIDGGGGDDAAVRAADGQADPPGGSSYSVAAAAAAATRMQDVYNVNADCLGRGGNGAVFKCRLRRRRDQAPGGGGGGTPIALKVIPAAAASTREAIRARDKLHIELATLYICRSPHIVDFYGAFCFHGVRIPGFCCVVRGGGFLDEMSNNPPQLK